MLGEKKISRTSKSVLLIAVGVIGAMVLASGFTAIGFVTAYQLYNSDSQNQTPLILKAESAAGGEGLSFATGIIARDIDGLFVLDHLTGNLQCWLLNPKTGQIGGIFQTNVNADMGVTKAGDADFVIVTARIDTTGQGREQNLRPGASICYVGDGNSGKVVAYGLLFDRPRLLVGNDVQEGTLEVVARGLARGVAERDQ